MSDRPCLKMPALLATSMLLLAATTEDALAKGRPADGPPGLTGAAEGRANDRAREATGTTAPSNPAGDQTTENQPDESGISYEDTGGDQTTENNPDEGDVQYEQDP
jgi:hypothetical protein